MDTTRDSTDRIPTIDSIDLDVTTARAVLWLLARQRGVISRWQLMWLGLDENRVQRFHRANGLVTVQRGVYVLPDRHRDPAAQPWTGLLGVSPRSVNRHITLEARDAARLALGVAAETAIVTGWSAAHLRRLTEALPEVPYLLMPPEQHRSRPGIDVVRAPVEPMHWDMLGELRVARGHRLAWDMAWSLRDRTGADRLLRDVLVAADRTRLLAVEEAIGMVEEPATFDLPRKVPRLLRQVVEDLRPGFSHSATEALARLEVTEIADSIGLYVEPRPHAISSGGRIIAEADIAIRQVRHDIEIDGPHHRHPAQQWWDRRRDRRLAQVPWTVSRHDVSLIDDDLPRFRTLVTEELRRLVDEAA